MVAYAADHVIHGLVGIWSLSDFKATVPWLITAGLDMEHCTMDREPSPKQLIRGIARNGLSIAVLLDFLIGWVEIPLWVALLLIPIAAF